MATYTHKYFNDPSLCLHGPLVPLRRDVTVAGDATPTGVLTFGANLGDIIKLGMARRGEIVHDALVQTSDLDTNGAPAIVFSLEITNGVTTKTIIHQSTAAQAGGLARPSLAPATEDGVGFVVPDGTYWYQLIVDTAAATSVANAEIHVHVDRHWYRESGEITE